MESEEPQEFIDLIAFQNLKIKRIEFEGAEMRIYCSRHKKNYIIRIKNAEILRLEKDQQVLILEKLFPAKPCIPSSVTYPNYPVSPCQITTTTGI